MTDKYIDPQLAAMSQAQDPAGPWERREGFKSLTIATGADHTNSAGRSVVSNGQVVRTETAGASRGSSLAAIEQQYGSAALPFDLAIDPRTRCPISPHELQEDSIVHFGAHEMTIAQARAASFLPPDWQRPGMHSTSKQDATRETTPLAETNPKQEAETDPALQGEAFANRAADAALTAIINKSGGVEQMAAVQEIVETGQVDERTLSTLATQMAMEPEQLRTQFTPIMAEFEKQGRAVFSHGGLDADEVITWAQDNRHDALQRAMHLHATQRNTRGYATLRNEFLANLGESNPERALAADLGQGVTSYRDDKGRVVVRLASGETMLWKTAIEAFGPK